MAGAKSLTGQSRTAGWALLNVHPDYLCFDGAMTGPREYSVTNYKSFLDYVRRQYDGTFWNTTPREVARFCARAMNALIASEG
jgi:hypothetical protein